MANPCGCEDSNTKQASLAGISSDQVDQVAQCPVTVHETVCIDADVTITPSVQVGDVRSFCVDNPFIGSCTGTPSPTRTCTFTVGQRICVQIPLTFSATASAVERSIICGTPITGPCVGTAGCTFTRGFFLNHPDFTNELIGNAGGSIILGIDQQGFSFTVTPQNASTVLSGNTPLQPGLPPIYENLYAQLLTADLNVQNGATCDFATTIIAAANTFLATSPPDQVVASNLVNELTLFNEGFAPDCPGHCSEG